MMWPTQWYAGSGGQHPSLRDRALSATRHPAFTSEIAVHLVHGVSWRRLRDLWDATSETLSQPIDNGTRLAQAMLRQELLREMQAANPDRFEAWYQRLHQPQGRGSRGGSALRRNPR
jgi:hypothetical protein